MIVTGTGLLVSPGANVSGPPAGTKSSTPAVPGTVAQSTVTGWVLARSRLTVRVAGVESPSSTVTSLILNAGRVPGTCTVTVCW